MKQIIRTAKTTRRPMIRPLDNGYFEPPHWRARKREMIAGIRKRLPMISNVFKRSFQPSSATPLVTNLASEKEEYCKCSLTEVGGNRFLLPMIEESDSDYGDEADRKVYVEAEAPCYFILYGIKLSRWWEISEAGRATYCEDASKQRTSNARNTVHATNNPHYAID